MSFEIRRRVIDGTINIVRNISFSAVSGTLAQLNTAVTDAVVASLAGTETLTNKTLTGPKVDAVKDTNGTSVLAFSTTASAVNYLSLTNAVNFGFPVLACLGTSTNIGVQLLPKGTGSFQIYCAAAKTPTIDASGADTNVDLNVTTKGTGQLKSNGNPVAVEVAAPATAASAGVAGQIAYDSGFIYVCTATNTWKRAAIAAW